jgi:hypothetical protein
VQDVLIVGAGTPNDSIGLDGQWYLDTLTRCCGDPRRGVWPSDPIRPDRGVQQLRIDTVGAESHLVVVYSTGHEVDLGNVRGAAGKDARPWPTLNVLDYGATGDGATDDTAAIYAALSALPEGGVLGFPVGTYLISSPIVLLRNRGLLGLHAGIWPYDTGGPVRIKASTAFVGEALIRLKDEEELYGTVGAAANGLQVGPNDQSGQAVQRITLDGFTVGAGVDGIQATGLVRSVRLTDVAVRRVTGSAFRTVGYVRKDGLTYYPRGWRITGCTADSAGNNGYSLNLLNDSTLIDCLAVGNTSHGFYVAGPGELLMLGCRAAWNKARGYYLTGTSYGNTLLSACTTDRNEQSGIFTDCTGRQPIVIAGATLRRDGRNNNGGGGSYAGLLVSGATAPVIVSALSTETGQDDTGLGSMSPQYGLRVLNSTAVVVESGVLWGMTAASLDGGGNGMLRIGAGVLRATGSPAAPTYVNGGELSLTYGGRALFAKTTSGVDHVATFYQAATAGVDVASALNVTSDNPDSSAMYLSGTEKNRGTLKIAHRGYADGSDAGAAALSMDLQTSGSKARGIYLWTTDGGQLGDPITVRVSSAVTALAREDFVLKPTGRCGMGIPIGATPAGMLDLRLPDATTPGFVVTSFGATGTDLFQARRASDSAVRTRISRDLQLITLENLYAAGPGLQVGATSNTFGGGSGVLGIANATTVPAANPVGGIVVYAEAGVLKWRDPNGTVYPLNNTGTGGTAPATGGGDDAGGLFVPHPIDPNVPLEITIVSNWGITDAGDTYYDEAGAPAAEAGLLIPDPETGSVAVWRPGAPWNDYLDGRVAALLGNPASATAAAVVSDLWQVPGSQSIANFADAAGWPRLSFRKESTKTVRVRGGLGGATVTAGQVLFTLPVGYRPLTNQIIAANGSVVLYVAANGDVTFAAAGTLPNVLLNDTFSLD